MASSEASWSGSTVFSKRITLGTAGQGLKEAMFGNELCTLTVSH